MFKVPIDKIIPVTSARARISSLVKKVNESGSMYVLTRGGKPAAILSSIEMFERSQKELDARDQKDQEESKKPAPKIEPKKKPIEMENVQDEQKLASIDQNVQQDVNDVDPIVENVSDDRNDFFSEQPHDENVADENDEQPVKISIKQ